MGRANLSAAFPRKSTAQIEAILAGVGDNLGRVGAKFADRDHNWDYDPARLEGARVKIDDRSYELFTQLQLDGSKSAPSGTPY